MVSGTTVASSGLAVDDCAGFAEPADILSRLTPDDLHPARLSGPHAWHPWGLTVTPPSDRHIRLVLAADTRPETIDLLIERLERQLTRTPWPPEAPLAVRRRDSRLDCRVDAARRSLIEISLAPDAEHRGHTEVVTRNGWPILGELAALNDRIRHINPDSPAGTDLADLTRWVVHKMAEPGVDNSLVAPLPQLLTKQARDHPDAASGLRTILAQDGSPAMREGGVLDYLAEQIDQSLVRRHEQRR